MSTLNTTNLKNPSSGSNNIQLGTDGSSTLTTAKLTTLADSAGSNTSTPAQIASGRAKAWVNFDGTGTVAIRASYNVSSITDNGQGNYTVNFTTAMPDGNYSICGTTDYEGTTVNQGLSVRNNNNGGTTSFQVLLTAYDGTLFDNAGIHIAIFR